MASKKVAKGKRYTPEEKQKIVDFVHESNRPSGRGGVTAAVKKFGVHAYHQLLAEEEFGFCSQGKQRSRHKE